MHNFINFHVLITHSPSCLNRDDMNMQKSATFGGVRRVRISSQSLKRAIRCSDEYGRRLGERSVRTRDLARLSERFVAALDGRYPAERVRQAIAWMAGKDGLTEDAEASAVAPWAVAEVARMCAAIAAGEAEGLEVKKLQKQIEKDAEAFRDAAAQTLDIALSGRMSTSDLLTPVDGALAVAHVITTHAVDSDIDWFTAVDDLVSEAGETGAGHLNTQEFSSGTFYRYASLNLAQLQENLGGATRGRALEIAGHLAYLFATVVPQAKQQTFAAHNLADAVLVSFADLPVSLANAFEAPVSAERSGGFRKPSQGRLFDYWRQVHRGYGLDESPAAFVLDGVQPPEGITAQPDLAALIAWIGRDGRD